MWKEPTKEKQANEANAPLELVDTSKYFNNGRKTDEYFLLDDLQKVTVLVQQHLEKTHKNFNELSDEKKQELVEKHRNIIQTQLNKVEEIDDNRVLCEFAEQIIEHLERSDKSLTNRSVRKSAEKILALIRGKKTDDHNDEHGENDIHTQGLERKFNSLKVDCEDYIREILVKHDETYRNLKTGEEKNKYIENKLKEFLALDIAQNTDSIATYGITREEHHSEELQSVVNMENLKSTLKNAIDKDNPLEDLQKAYTDKLEYLNNQIEQIDKEIEVATIKKANQRRLDELETKRNILVIDEYLTTQNISIKEMSEQELNETFQKLLNDPKTPKEIKEAITNVSTLATTKNSVENRDQRFKTDEHYYSTSVRLNEFARKHKITNKTNAEAILSDVKKTPRKLQNNVLSGYIEYAIVNNNKALLDETLKAMENLGFSKEEINEIRTEAELKSASQQTANIKDADDFKKAADLNRFQEIATAKALDLVAKAAGSQAAILAQFENQNNVKTAAKTLNDNCSTEHNTEVLDKLAKNKDASAGTVSNFTESLIETAKSDKDRVNYANDFSKMGNSAVLEGVAAGADSVQDKDYRNQYTSIVTQAAQSYPPEVQNTIQTALKTGEISQSTMNSSEPVTNSYYKEADTYTAPTSTSSNTTHSTTTTTQVGGNNTNYNNTTRAEAYAPNMYTSAPIRDIATRDGIINPADVISNSNSQVNNTHSTTSKINPQQVKFDAATKQAEANQRMKDIALENVAEVKQKIDESIAEWEVKQELKLTDEVISELKQIAASEAVEEYIEANPTRKEEILKKLSNADSLSEVYDILLSNLGSRVHQKFIDRLATCGSSSDVRAFLKSKAGNADVIKEILLRTSNQTLRSELINMLPDSDVIELLEKNLISTLNGVDHKIIYEYLAKNIYSLTQTNFANYLKYLPFDEREKLIAMRNKAYGIKSEQEQQVQAQNQAQDVQNIQGIQQNGQALPLGQTAQANQPRVATNPQAQQHNTLNQQKAENTQQQNPQTKFQANETTKVLNDGRVITRQGTSFAGISNNTEEGFRVVDPEANKKAKQGAPIGMNDEVLVPGSQEWLMKYNKQAPKTAFTMAALEEQAEDTGLNLSSNHAKIGQPIKKKYNPNSFNLRG